MERAHPKRVAEGVQRNGLVEVPLDIAANGADIGRARVGRRLRPTPQTGAEAGLLGGHGLFEELNVPAQSAPRWARNPAIDPGRGHRRDEAAVVGRVWVENGLAFFRIVELLRGGR